MDLVQIAQHADDLERATAFYTSLLGTGPMPWDLIVPGAFTATLLFVSGAFYFRRLEAVFADVA